MCVLLCLCVFFLCYEAKVIGTEAFVRAAAVKKERSSIGRCFNKTKKQKEIKKATPTFLGLRDFLNAYL